jgi:ATP-dependent Lon protease
MRDFRDAKAMAQTLRDSLTNKAITISHSESLELVSKMLGLADWNTLSALLQTDRREAPTPAASPRGPTATYPVVPLRDLVPFPGTTFPLFVGREKTMQALNHAFERQREVVLAVQKESGVDDPGFDDVCEIGVLAKLLELETLPDGTIRVLTQGYRRVAIRGFAIESGAFHADVADISEDGFLAAPDLIRRAVRRFEIYAAAREIRIPEIWPLLEQTHDAGRVADIIASRVRMPLDEKYRLLATLDPVMRLERAEALVDLSVRPFSPLFETTRQRALHFANQRQHQYATLEHLLLALIEDIHAHAVMQACKADLDGLKGGLIEYLDDELKNLVITNSGNAEPTTAFRRVMQRAAFHAQEVGYPVITGANVLFGIFAESRSPAAHLLSEKGVSLEGAAKAIARGIGKGTG